MRRQLVEVLESLDHREQAVVRMRYGLDDGTPHTLDDIGKAFGLSREADPPDRARDHVQAAGTRRGPRCCATTSRNPPPA
jgi:hypothetical protein